MSFEKNIKWIGIGISVILLLILGFLVVESKRETEEKKALEAKLENKTIPYMKEISDIQNDIVAKKKEMEEQEEGSLGIFRISVVSFQKNEAEKVKKLTENMKMPISIVLNDRMGYRNGKRSILSSRCKTL